MIRRKRGGRPQGPAGNAKMTREQGASIITDEQDGKAQASRLLVILSDNILVSMFPFR